MTHAHVMTQETQTAELKAATALVRGVIQKQTAAFRSATGERIYTHYADGRYAATLNCGTSWLDYLLQDQINEKLEATGLPFEAEYLSDYEIGLEAL